MVELGYFMAPYLLLVFIWVLDADVSGLSGGYRSPTTHAPYVILLLLTLISTTPMLLLAWLAWLRDQASKRAIRKVSDPWFLLLILPAGWVLGEWLRSVLISAVFYGPNGSLGDYWNFGSLGLAAVQSPLAALSKIVGLYGLTWLVVATSGLILLLLTKQSRQIKTRLAIGLVLVIVSSIFIKGAWVSQSGAAKQGSVLQLSYLTPDFFGPAKINNQIPNKKDLIVLPEYSGVFAANYSDFAKTYVTGRLANDGSAIDVDEWHNNGRYTVLQLRDNQGRLVDQHTKGFLIPTGEFLPTIVSSYYRFTGQQAVVDSFTANRLIKKGDSPKVFTGQQLEIGAVSCSGILSKTDYQRLTRQGAEVLTNSASLIILNKSQSYFRQSLAMAKFHSIANARVFIQASKQAPAFVLDQTGNYIVKPDEIKDQFTDFQFHTNTQKTVYSQLGEWVLWLSTGVIVVYLAWPRLQRRVK